MVLSLALALALQVPPAAPPPTVDPAVDPAADPAAERVPAALQSEPEQAAAAAAPPPPAAPAASATPTSATPTSATPTSATPGVEAEAKPARRVGDPLPLTRREPTLDALQFMVGARYGLVGTGPTRFTNDIRFGVTDWLELRTSLLPYPSSLMARARIGAQQSELGAFLLDAGLAHWDAGLRVVPDTGEANVGMRFHLEGGLGYARTLGERLSVNGQAHYRYRLSLLPDDGQHAVAVDARLNYDLLDSLAVSAGLGFASTLGGPVRELSVIFVETDGQGMSHLLSRDEGGQQSLTLPLALTYGRVESFDVDLFCTPRVWPEPGILFGAGVRLRLDPFKG